MYQPTKQQADPEPVMRHQHFTSHDTPTTPARLLSATVMIQTEKRPQTMGIARIPQNQALAVTPNNQPTAASSQRRIWKVRTGMGLVPLKIINIQDSNFLPNYA